MVRAVQVPSVFSPCELRVSGASQDKICAWQKSLGSQRDKGLGWVHVALGEIECWAPANASTNV